MIRFRYYAKGTVVFVRYTFGEKGDRLPMHAHQKKDEHNVIVLSGKVRLNGAIHLAGEVLDFDSSLPHEIEALEPMTETIHLMIQPNLSEFLDMHDVTGDLI